MKLLFKNASILMEDWSVLKDAFLGVDGDTICYIGQDRPQEDYDSEKDMSGKMLMPGIYNMHAHVPMSILRGIGSGLPLDKWLFDAIFPLAFLFGHFCSQSRITLTENDDGITHNAHSVELVTLFHSLWIVHIIKTIACIFDVLLVIKEALFVNLA